MAKSGSKTNSTNRKAIGDPKPKLSRSSIAAAKSGLLLPPARIDRPFVLALLDLANGAPADAQGANFDQGRFELAVCDLRALRRLGFLAPRQGEDVLGNGEFAAAFRLTDSGLAFAKLLESLIERNVELSEPQRAEIVRCLAHWDCPAWDSHRQLLRVGPIAVTSFRRPAEFQTRILTTFEAKAWTRRISNPLPKDPEVDDLERLHDGVKNLNRRQKIPLVQFLTVGGGAAVEWDFRPFGA